MPMGTAGAFDARNGHRSNVFLAAVIHAGGSCYPVRIRNLSRSGALIDGNDVPGEGEAIRLQRGPHSAIATVVWRRGGACGVVFSSAVPVREWTAYGAAHKGQRRVDSIVASVRARATPLASAATPSAAAAGNCPVTAAELHLVSGRLRAVTADLARDPAVIEGSAGALQELDAATEKLVELAARIRTGEV